MEFGHLANSNKMLNRITRKDTQVKQMHPIVDAQSNLAVTIKVCNMKIYEVNHICIRVIRAMLGLALAMLTTQAMAVITGSSHDFAAAVAWNGTGEICATCHTPHNAGGAATGPLWNHTETAAAFTVYTSPTGTLDQVAAQPGGASKLCLSCHDGTVALDSFGGNTGIVTPVFIGTVNATADLGTDLSNDHPISITYDNSAATGDIALHDPATKSADIGEGVFLKAGTIAENLIPTGNVECSSCHDVHNTNTVASSTKLLKISMTGSALCLTCHNK